MMPSNAKYPDFVPDQLLTRDNLNDLFRYLDEQGRMTRTNLLGVGIVCGLEVRTAADGTGITIGQGTGITSEGYLVALPQATYTERIDFDPAQEIFYGKFLNASNQKKFDLWELKRTAAVEGAVPLTLGFLNGGGVESQKKVVLVFVELLQEQNKNCNPESCDDKGVTVNVNLRVLLARKQDVDGFGLKGGVSVPNAFYNDDFASLAEPRMRRFDVPATGVSSAAGLLTAYKRILTGSFLSSVEHTLTLAWSHFKPLLEAEFLDANPFQNLAETFAWINNGSATPARLLELQYVYDHFSDLLAAYAEYRRTGMEILGLCCPDANLFPRHLLLDLAIGGTNAAHSAYRHHFRPSPLFEKRDLLTRLRTLFRRLVRLANHFAVPAPAGSASNPDPFIRITPSRLDPVPLSAKAIPFYYEADKPPARPLYTLWSYEKTEAGEARTNLSYHAGLYANKDFASHPLAFDLEPYNFLRVEGHIGKTFSHVLKNLDRLKKENRLPFDVVALNLGTDASDTEIADVSTLRDIRMQYEVLKAETICCLKRQVGYWGKLTIKQDFKYGKLNLATNLFSLNLSQAVLDKIQAANILKSAAAKAAFSVEGAAAPSGAPKAAAPESIGISGASGEKAKANAASGATGKAVAGAAGGAAGSMAMGASDQAQAKVIEAGVSRKADVIYGILGEQGNQALAQAYFDFQSHGDFNLSRIPPPAVERLDEATVSHFALQILDEVGELLVLLEADDPLSLDVDALKAHGKTLEEILAALLERVEKDMADLRPFQKIKAYVGDSRAAKVDALAESMPTISDEQANAVTLILLNATEAEQSAFLNQIRLQRGNLSAQASLINLYYGRLDKDGMMVPPSKDVTVTEDAFLRELRDRLKNFTCLCTLAGFAKLRSLLAAILAELKQANLFSVFASRHPGIQHKAGVPMGGTFILAYQRKGAKPGDNPDPQFAKAAAEFGDGTVVADFYLPYQIRSEQPPILFQVNDAEPVPEEVTLALQPNPATGALRYNVADETPYAFSHVPNNGTLTNGAAANGVTTVSADTFVFTPSRAKDLLGNDAKTEIEFGYVKRGVESEKLRVAVYNRPAAEIKNSGKSNEVEPGTEITLKGTVKFADKLAWTVQDATGASKQVAETRDLTDFPLAKAGTYTFTLRAMQPETGAFAISNSITIEVRKNPEQPAKICGSLLLILESYAKLAAVDPQRFKAFDAAFLDKQGLNAYFAKLKDIADAPPNRQIEFFASKAGDNLDFAALLRGWLKNLADGILATKAKGQRLLPLALYRILAELLLYVSCLRKEDLGKAEEQVFADMLGHLKGKGSAKGFLTLKDLTDPEKALLAALGGDFEEENKRNAVNNKITPKPKYARVLKTITAAF